MLLIRPFIRLNRNRIKAYHIIFFIIDGDGFNTPGTRRAIVRASALPVSIILIGVGGSSFTNLSQYDADNHALTTTEGVSSVRDAVQFVRFEDCRTSDGSINAAMLAAELLHEVPTQVEQYCALYGITAPDIMDDDGGDEEDIGQGEAPPFTEAAKPPPAGTK